MQGPLSIPTLFNDVQYLAQGWVEPSYRQVYEIVKALPQALVTLARGVRGDVSGGI
jgi:hypothetical protein